LLTGDESGEMPFSSCVGTGGPRDEVRLKRRSDCIASTWYLLVAVVWMGSFIEVGGFDADFFDDDRCEELEVATCFFDKLEVAEAFLGGINGALGPENFLLSCRSCAGGGGYGSARTRRPSGASTGLQ
jgi:hypothetical protein